MTLASNGMDPWVFASVRVVTRKDDEVFDGSVWPLAHASLSMALVSRALSVSVEMKGMARAPPARSAQASSPSFPRSDCRSMRPTKACQGKAMERFVEDYQKRRLTERVDIMTAINILMSQGYDEDDLLGEITKVFYVDLDAYNEVIEHH